MLSVPPPDVLSRVRRHLSYDYLRLWDDLPDCPSRPLQALPVRAWDSWPVKNPQSLPSRPWLSTGPLRLNTLLWPSGASRWSAFHAIVDDAAMNAIRGATGSFGQPLVIDDGSSPVLSVTMYPLPPRPLSQIAGANGFSLLTLLDRRAYWPWLSAEIDVVGGTTTWAGLFAAVAAALGVTLAVDDVPAAYLSPPAALSSAYDSLPALLDAACLSCGLRFAAALDGTSYRCWSVVSAQQQVARNLAAVANPRVAGGTFLQGTDANGVLPAAVQVVFPRADDGTPDPTPVAVAVTLASLNLPANPPGGPALGGIGGLTKTFHSSAVATYSAGSPTNSAALSALATQAATDFYTWQTAASHDVAFAGVAPWLPTGADGLCEYAHSPDTGAGGGILSRFRRDSYFDGREALWHHTATPCAAIPSRVRVTGTTLTDTCLYAAELVTRSGCADTTVSPAVPVWLRVDGVSPGSPAPAPAAGDLHLAAPEGVRAADGLPVYVTSERPAVAVGGHITNNTTTTIDPAVTWNVTGGSATTSVFDVTNLTYKYESTVTLVFAGPAWDVTANTTCTVGSLTALTFVGVSSTTSVVNVSTLTWNYNSTSVLVFAGPAWDITASTTTTITAGQTWLVTGGTVQYASTTIDVHTGCVVNITDNTTWTITTLKVWTVTGGSLDWTNITLVFGAGSVVNLTADQTWTVTAGAAWTVTGGTLNLNSTVVFGGPSFTFNSSPNYIYICDDLIFDICSTPHVPGPVVQMKPKLLPIGGIHIPGPTPQPVVIDPGATWPIQGAVDFTGPVTGAGGLMTSTGTRYQGTTADAYAVIFDLVNGQGIIGDYTYKNTSMLASAQLRVTTTDMYGTVGVSTPAVSTGSAVNYDWSDGADLSSRAVGLPPFKEIKVEVRSNVPGSPATYDSYLTTAAASALNLANGGTGSDLSATGGPGQVAMQTSTGGPLVPQRLGQDAMPGPEKINVARSFR